MNCGHCGKQIDERQTVNIGPRSLVCLDCEEKLTDKTHWWCSGLSGLITLELKTSTIEACSHSGDCTADVQLELEESYIQNQIKDIEPALLRRELDEYGCWDDEELSNHQDNLERLLWIACGDVYDSEEYLETLEAAR
jgi:hypothetical protein